MDSFRLIPVTARVLTVGAGSTGRALFGPFPPGVSVRRIFLALVQRRPYTIDPVTGVATGDGITVAVFASIQVFGFGAAPADTAAAFSANGRALFADTTRPRLPSCAEAMLEVPCVWVAGSNERWLGVEVTETAGTGNIEGGVYLDVDVPETVTSETEEGEYAGPQ